MGPLGPQGHRSTWERLGPQLWLMDSRGTRVPIGPSPWGKAGVVAGVVDGVPMGPSCGARVAMAVVAMAEVITSEFTVAGVFDSIPGSLWLGLWRGRCGKF